MMNIKQFLIRSILSLLLLSNAVPALYVYGTDDAAEHPQGRYNIAINEVCASNKDSLTLQSGTSPDWIELFNTGTENVDLRGVGLSDGNKNRFKYTFPEGCQLAAGAFLLIACDDSASVSDELHANFKISSSGETIYLTAPDGSDIDMITVPPLDTDISYGRTEDGSDGYALLTPTPGTSNTPAEVMNPVEPPAFSHEAGFYSEEFLLSLSGSGEILYTTDGSDPKTSVSAQPYSDSIRIYDNTDEPNRLSAIEDITLMPYSAPDYPVDKGIVVRAVCRNGEGQFSKTVTNNFFVNKTAAYYQDLKVIALSTDEGSLFDAETGIYVVGNQYEIWKSSSDYNPNLSISSKSNPTNYNMEGKEWERPCSIQVFEHGNPVFSEDAGIRIAGQWSTAYPQKSLTLYARKEYGSGKLKYDFFDGTAKDQDGKTIKEFKKVTLRNGGSDYAKCRFRDDLNQELAENLNFGRQAKCNYVVFLDGEFWGHYSMQEKIDGNYLASHYGCDAGDVTIIKNGKSFDGSEEEYNQFRLFWEWAMEADMKDPANYQRVCDTIDVNGYIDFIAFENYIINWDCLENPNNWRVWRENNSEGKWRFILFDTEQSCGHNAKTMPAIDCFEKMDRSKSKNSISSLFFCLFENDRFKQAFYNRYRDIVSDNFRQTEVSELIDRYDSTVKSVVYDTFRRFGVKNVYEEQVRTVRQFYSQRSAYALQYLEQFYDSFRSAGTETTAPVLETTTESTYLTTTESTETQAVSSASSDSDEANPDISAKENQIASDDTLCRWAVNDCARKTGRKDLSAEITLKSEKLYEITLKDKDHAVMTVYSIDPVTGCGSDSADNVVNLPQTGNSGTQQRLMICAAWLLICIGLPAVRGSGIIRPRKK